MKILAARVGNLRGIDLLYAAIIKWTMPGCTQVRSHMAVLQTLWKEAKRLHRVTTVSDWVDKMLTAQSRLEEAGQALGDRVMYDFIIDSLVPPPPPHPYNESYGCAADAPAVAEFVKLQRTMTDCDLLKLVDGICEHSPATAATAKANKSDVKCQICGHWGHEGRQCEDLKGVQLPRSSGRPHDPPRLKQQPGGGPRKPDTKPDDKVEECNYCRGRGHNESRCFHKKRGWAKGLNKAGVTQCTKCGGKGHNESQCPSNVNARAAAVQKNSGGEPATEAKQFSMQDMLKFAQQWGASQADSVTPFKIHGRHAGVCFESPSKVAVGAQRANVASPNTDDYCMIGTGTFMNICKSASDCDVQPANLSVTDLHGNSVPAAGLFDDSAELVSTSGEPVLVEMDDSILDPSVEDDLLAPRASIYPQGGHLVINSHGATVVSADGQLVATLRKDGMDWLPSHAGLLTNTNPSAIIDALMQSIACAGVPSQPRRESVPVPMAKREHALVLANRGSTVQPKPKVLSICWPLARALLSHVSRERAMKTVKCTDGLEIIFRPEDDSYIC